MAKTNENPTPENKNSLEIVSDRLEILLQEKANALPQDFNQTRFIQNAMVVLTASDKKVRAAIKANPISAARAIAKGAYLNLDFFMRECYVIPYSDSLEFQTDYKGEIKVLEMYSVKPVREVYAKCVRKGDQYQETIHGDGKPGVIFDPIPFNDADIVGVFAVCNFENGGTLFESMSTKEIEHIRKSFSKAPNSSAWTKTWGEMAKKTVIRRLVKPIPIEFKTREAQLAYDSGGDAEFKERLREPIQMPKEIQDAEIIDDEEGHESDEDIEGKVIEGLHSKIKLLMAKFQDIRRMEAFKNILTEHKIKDFAKTQNVDLLQAVVDDLQAFLKGKQV